MRTVNMKNKILFFFALALSLSGAAILGGWNKAEANIPFASYPYDFYYLDSAGNEIPAAGLPPVLADVTTPWDFGASYNTGIKIIARPKAAFYSLPGKFTFVVSAGGDPINSPVESNNLTKGISFDENTGIFSGTIGNIKIPKDLSSANPTGVYGYTVSRGSKNYTFYLHIQPGPCSPQISAPYLDPDYVATTTLNRHFTPKLPVNPFDNFSIDIDLTNCPKTDTYSLSITTVDVNGSPVTIVAPHPIAWVGSYTVYTINLYGWPDDGRPGGIGLNAAANEALVDSIVNNRPVNIILSKSGTTGSAISKTKPVFMSSCVNVEGSGNHRIVYLREAGIDSQILPNQSSVNEMVTRTIDTVNGFVVTAPFNSLNSKTNKSYSAEFRHILDLRKYVNPEWRDPALDLLKSLGAKSFLAGDGDFDSCSPGHGILVGVTTIKASAGLHGISRTSTGRALIDYKSFIKGQTTFIHEFGHIFADLLDEYILSKPPTSPNYFIPGKNCAAYIDDGVFSGLLNFEYNGISYAQSPKLGCTALQTASVPPKGVWRPSDGSIMSSSVVGGEKFNVPSCAFILSVLTGQSAHSLFPNCAAMVGIDK